MSLMHSFSSARLSRLSRLARRCPVSWPILVLAAAALGGCASQAVTRSGYLASYDGLLPESTNSKILVERPSAALLHSYDAVYVEPVEVRVPDTEDASAMKEVADLATAAMRKELSLEWPLAEGPAAARTLRVRTALTAVKTSNPALNVFLFIILPVPLDNGGLSAEAAFVDGDSGSQVGAIVWAGQGLWNPSGYFSAYGHPRELTGDLARSIAAALKRPRADLTGEAGMAAGFKSITIPDPPVPANRRGTP